MTLNESFDSTAYLDEPEKGNEPQRSFANPSFVADEPPVTETKES